MIGRWYAQANAKVRRVFWTCSVAWGLDSMDGLVYQYLIPSLLLAFGMSLTEAGSIASANYFASAVGGWLGGWLCDRFGRARILQITILWFSFFSFLSGFAQSYEQLLVIRVLQGLGFGAEWAVGAVLLGEMVERRHRGKAVGTMHSAAAVGSGLAALLAGPVASSFAPEYGWRVAFWAGALPAVLVFFVRRSDDDSEVYKEAIRRARAAGRKTKVLAIFSPAMLRTTVLASLLALGAQGAGYAVSNYLTAFLQHERGLSASVAGLYVLVNSAGGFFGFLANASLTDRVGRRRIFQLFGAGFVLAAAFYLYAPLGSSPFLLLLAGFVYGFFQFGIYASFGPYFTELFPTEMRGTGQAFAYNFGRACSGLFIQSVALVAALTSLGNAMLIVGATGMACAIVATLLLPETAGRDLAALDCEPDPPRAAGESTLEVR
ncbi:MAG: MFS transporter [Pseudomonadota bacterium]|jgi:Arabinose efflux permease|nr:MAG: MFS transporter [Pseudomonadota bacterium]